MPCQIFRFFVNSSIALWQIFQLPELPEHSSANVTYIMVSAQAKMLCKGKVFFRQLKYNFDMFSKVYSQSKTSKTQNLPL